MTFATLEHRFRVALLFVCVLSLLAFGVADRQLPLTLAFIVTAVGGWVVTERGGGGLPRWLTSTILFILISGLLYRAIYNIPVVSLFTMFLEVVMLLKLWERRVIRDYAQILTISLFLVVGTVLTDPGLATGAVLLVLLPFFVWTVMLYQLHNQAVAAGAREVAWPTMRRAFHGAASFAIIAGSALATAAFILIPRGYGLGGSLQGASRLAGLQAGFAEDVRLGQGGIISQSSTPVFEVGLVYLTDQTHPIGGPDEPQYFRGIVLSTYENGRWSPAPASPDHQVRPEERVSNQLFTYGQNPDSRTPTIVQSFRPLMPPRDGSPLFALYRPFAVQMREANQLTHLDIEPNDFWMRRPVFDGAAQYTVLSAPGWNPNLIPDPNGRLMPYRSRRGRVSFPSAKVADLARRLLTDNNIEPDPAKRDPADDERALNVLRSHLQRRCRYSLANTPPPLGVDPTEWFLFDSRQGHCEYFASAMAALARSVGIDARVIGGYLATEYDESRQVYVVRAWNAHAWVEANVDDYRWITLDATPPADLQELRERSNAMFVTLTRWLDNLQAGWNSSVVTFDQSMQAKLLGLSKGHEAHTAPESLGAHLRDTIDRLRGLRVRDVAMMGAPVVVLVGIVLLWRTVRRASRPNPDRPGWAFEHPAAALRADLIGILKGLGHTQPAWQSLDAFVAAAAAGDARVPRSAPAAARALTRAAMRPESARESLAAAHEAIARGA
ncbi:MAG: DUF3488 domain-containing protein [Tepidisphaera sp.]|nr:DUF3488 domain-containing protein [Tepidisphaera sp.]